MHERNEISVLEVQQVLMKYFIYLRYKIVPILLIALIFACAGVLYAYLQKPSYTAAITFSPENENGSGLGMYTGLAVQFGLDLGSGGGGVFEGENLMMLLKSRMLVEKALFSTVEIQDKKQLLIDYYLDIRRQEKEPNKNTILTTFKKYKPGDRTTDSLLSVLSKEVINNLEIEKLNKKVNILVARMTSNNELFAKLLVEQIIENGVQNYIEYRSGKTRENVEILKRQTDSVRNILSSGIRSVAASSDLNVNPVRQIVRTNTQNKQVDVQANGQLYGELLKQLELSKISLRKETPLIHIIDTPRLPLEKKKLGRLKGALIFGFIGTILALFYFIFRKVFSADIGKDKDSLMVKRKHVVPVG